MTKQGVIIANTGSPSAPTPDAVGSYLAEFLTDPRICPMNPTVWKVILKLFILPKRSQVSAEKYGRIWTESGSPLSAWMASLARGLEAQLDGVPVRYAMSYGTPSVAEVLEELRAEGCDELVVVPLYPQSAFSTTKVVEDKLEAALVSLDWNPKVTVVQEYCEQEAYVEAIAASVRDAGITAGDSLLMAFHSVPMKDVHAGDTYENQANATARAVAAALDIAPERWRIGFQCRFDSRKWVSPFTGEALQELAGNDGRLFVVAPNFSIDCLETLYDIEDTLKQDYVAAAGADALGDFVYVPCLNDSPRHVALLKQVVSQQF